MSTRDRNVISLGSTSRLVPPSVVDRLDNAGSLTSQAYRTPYPVTGIVLLFNNNNNNINYFFFSLYNKKGSLFIFLLSTSSSQKRQSRRKVSTKLLRYSLPVLLLYICILSHIATSLSLFFPFFVRLIDVFNTFLVFSTLLSLL
jgi:hypothetical protein